MRTVKPPVCDIKHLLALTVTISLGSFSITAPVFPQIVPDTTLPQNSTVTTDSNTIEINGGTVRGVHLFHSFQEFSLGTGETAFFNNNVSIENIFSRITGNNFSNIDGLIQANGAANLFLLNSNGIVFGPNAQLNIGGSFLASTADRLNFADGRFFSTQPTPNDPLLTVSIPSSLQIDNNPAEIRVEGSGHNFSLDPGTREIIRGEASGGLRVEPETTLGFVAGNITLDGGNLIAESGNIELFAVQDGAVQLDNSTGQLQLENSVTPTEYGTIQLLNTAAVDATGSRGGNIQIQGRQLLLTDGSAILSQTEGAQTGGDLIIRTSESVELIGTTPEPRLPEGFLESLPGENGELPSPEDLPFPPDGLFFPTTVVAETLGEGNAGNLLLETGQLTILNGASISTSTFGSGNTGTLTVRARDAISIEGASSDGFFPGGIFSSVTPPASGIGQPMSVETTELTVAFGGTISTGTFGTGRAGDLTIKAANFVDVLGGFIFSQTEGFAPGGNLLIETGRVLVGDGGEISASTFGDGDAGNLDIRAIGSVEVTGGFETPEGDFFPSGIFSQVNFVTIEDPETQELLNFPAGGSGGNVTIDTGRLIVEDGGLISASTTSEGSGGTVSINATEFVEITGITPTVNATPSGIFTLTEGAGFGGNTIVNTARLSARDGGQIAASTLGTGNGGTVTVNATESLELRGVGILPNGEVAQTVTVLEDGTVVPTEDNEILRSGIFARSREGALGNAGTVNVSTDELTVVDGATLTVSSRLGAETAAAGNLNINAAEIELENGLLTAETNAGESGNINVNSDIFLLRDRSQLTTNAESTTGGNISINTELLAALENSDITANARQGPGGRVTVDALGLFGTEFRDRESPDTSDITATSELGPEFDGIVDINTPDIDPNRGTVEFEEEIVDVAGLIDCDPCRLARGSEYLETGKGGIPQSPGDRLDPIAPWEDWSLTDELPENRSDSPPNPEDRSSHLPQQANAIERSETGEYRLISTTSAIDRPSPFLSPACPPFVPTKTLDPTDSPATAVTAVTLPVREFAIENSSAFTPDELAKIGAAYRDRSLTLAELDAVRSQLEQLYRDRGYLGTFAVIPPQTVRNGIVTVQVLENRLDKIDIQAIDRDRSAYTKYIENRLGLQPGDLLNRDRLLEALYTLQFDPRIESLSAELSEGVRPQTSFLTIRVREANPWRSQLSLDNGRVPSVGSFRRQAQLSQYNPLGLAGLATVNYANTDGSNTWDFAYTLPVNSRNGSLSFLYSRGASEIVEKPFNELDIEADSRNYEITYRQPVIQAIASRNPDLPLSEARDLVRTEIALGLTASRRESQTSILGVDFPLSPGAESDGETRISALRFFQEALRQDNRQIFAARSEFSLGLGVFDATTHDDGPDSRFFAWRGQAQWVRRLQDNPAPGRRAPLLLVRGDVQLSTSALLPLEQFGIGGSNSVRGYRQDSLLTDNGVLASVELQYPLWSFPRLGGSLSLIPFVDFGVGWNWDEGDRPQSDRNTLISTGLGLQLQLSNKFQARLDWGLPLIEIDSRERTWQENGVHFSVNFTPF
ncbi:MAG: filamentous hemagglutinin N-terminal domain-containing protein [Cyanobacteria bacterium J007]|nr:MAG: filamentous hemagglutinin N-terminal domain-containing protein [Cyanobacteria bacterium J007]